MSFTEKKPMAWFNSQGKIQMTEREVELRCAMPDCRKPTKSHSVDGQYVCHVCFQNLPKCSACGSITIGAVVAGVTYCPKCKIESTVTGTKGAEKNG